MKTFKQCQSCGMPLENKRGNHRGMEDDGSYSDRWCALCYDKGKFIMPELTIKDMYKIVDKALIDQRWPKPLRWLAMRQISSLERWRLQ